MVHEDTAFNTGKPSPDPIDSRQEFEVIWIELQAALIERARLERTRSWRRRANVRSTRFRHMRRATSGARL